MTTGINSDCFCPGCLEDLFQREGGYGILPAGGVLVTDANDGQDEHVSTIREVRDLLMDCPMWRVRAYTPANEKAIRGMV